MRCEAQVISGMDIIIQREKKAVKQVKVLSAKAEDRDIE